MDHLNRQITAGKASFAIGIFDINNLKQINDLCGHETGDRIIIQAADALTEVFGRENVFRIGGDEFVAVVEDADREQVARLGAQLQETILGLNRRPVHPQAELAVSKGFAVFDPHSDADYLALFRRADQRFRLLRGFLQEASPNCTPTITLQQPLPWLQGRLFRQSHR